MVEIIMNSESKNISVLCIITIYNFLLRMTHLLKIVSIHMARVCLWEAVTWTKAEIIKILQF